MREIFAKAWQRALVHNHDSGASNIPAVPLVNNKQPLESTASAVKVEPSLGLGPRVRRLSADAVVPVGAVPKASLPRPPLLDLSTISTSSSANTANNMMQVDSADPVQPISSSSHSHSASRTLPSVLCSQMRRLPTPLEVRARILAVAAEQSPALALDDALVPVTGLVAAALERFLLDILEAVVKYTPSGKVGSQRSKTKENAHVDASLNATIPLIEYDTGDEDDAEASGPDSLDPKKANLGPFSNSISTSNSASTSNRKRMARKRRPIDMARLQAVRHLFPHLFLEFTNFPYTHS